MRIAMRVPLVLLVAAMLAACASDSAKKENIEPPTPLVDFAPTATVQKLWSASVGNGAGEVGAGLVPAVVGGRVYFASVDGDLAAFDASSGKRFWSKEFEPFSGGPGASDSLVVAGTLNGALIAVDAETGLESWRARMSSEIISAPVVSGDLVVALANDGRTHALNARDGSQSWAVDRGVPLLSLRGSSTPIVTNDAVIVAGANGTVTALAIADGRPIWEQKVGVGEGRTDLERMVDVDGRMVLLNGDLFVVGYESGAQALTVDAGRILWSRDMSSVAGLAAGNEGVFIAASDGALWALDRRSGGALWKNELLSHRMLSVPVLMGDYVVVGDLEGYLHWFKRSDGEIAARVKLGGAGFGEGLVVVDDTLYVQNRDGSVGAFRLRN
jgi:outer membrane protein assembly factor BamB